MKLLLAIVLVLACSNEQPRGALYDCSLQIIQEQTSSTCEECGKEESCLSSVARQRALIAADYIANCVANSDGGVN